MATFIYSLLLGLVLAWVLGLLWITWIREERLFFILTLIPWVLAFTALGTFRYIAERNLHQAHPDDYAFYDTGVGFGYIAVFIISVPCVLIANALTTLAYLIYRKLHPPVTTLPIPESKSQSSSS